VITLLIGALLASVALAFVLYPLFDESAATAAPHPRSAHAPVLSAPSPVEALREIEFDRATGKLSEADYEALKATYTRQAIAEMRAGDAAPTASTTGSEDDPLEALIRAQRERLVACPSCGPRPEPDAVFCSSCGRSLAHDCARCGAEIREQDARYCSGCGNALAA
jgi:hypothetical protein